jgi:transposase-like protein
MNTSISGLNEMTVADLGKLTEDDARNMLEAIRWPQGPVCPHCGALDRATKLPANGKVRAGLYQCNDCRGQFTVTVDTIFEDSHIPLSKWILAFGLMCSSKKGISALQLQRNLGLGSYKSAWFMAHRIRYAMRVGPFPPKLRGTVEADETYVGARRKGKRGRGAANKTPVLALVARSGQMRARVIKGTTKQELQGAIRESVRRDGQIMTDELHSYWGIGKHFDGGHHTVGHGKKEYVRGDVHVNTAESFFALFKRGIHGTFHHISKRHLGRYTDEFAFRWNHRKVKDGARTVSALQATSGKRLTYRAKIA